MRSTLLCYGSIAWIALAGACGSELSRMDGASTLPRQGPKRNLEAAPRDDAERDGLCGGRVRFDVGDARLESELNTARHVVCHKYLHLADALDDGYVNSGLPCVPGQGYHFVKPSLFGTTDIRQPPVLMYTKDGELNSPEWVTPDDVPAPTVFGQREHADDDLGLSILHVWVWKTNVNGVFDDVNPAVTCP